MPPTWNTPSSLDWHPAHKGARREGPGAKASERALREEDDDTECQRDDREGLDQRDTKERAAEDGTARFRLASDAFDVLLMTMPSPTPEPTAAKPSRSATAMS